MTKKKSPRNKTIDFALEEGREYLERCITVEQSADLSDVLNKTIKGDTFEVLSYIPQNSIDLVIADPPYNLDKDFHGNSFKKLDIVGYEEYTREWLELVLPLVKDGGTIYICGDYISSVSIANVLYEYSDELTIRNRITWQREKGRGAKTNWKNGMEDIWFVTKGKNYKFNVDDVKIRRKVLAPYKTDGVPKDWEMTEQGNFRDTYPSNFWDDITIPFWSMPENTAHPTQKSEKLLAKLILASSDKGDTVLDPFLGSGSTSVTAKKLGRNYVGIEMNPQYCAWAEYRLERAETDDYIQGYQDNVFWERNSLQEQKKIPKRNEAKVDDTIEETRLF